MPRIHRRQRNWLMGGLVLVLLMGVFPPFQAHRPSIGFNARQARHLGYRFLLAPPNPADRHPALSGRQAAVDAPLLLFQCFVVAVVVGIGCMSGGHEGQPSAAATSPVAPPPSL